MASHPAAAQATSSEESSGAKSRSSSPPAPPRNESREAVPKVPLSRVLGSTTSTAKPQESTQSVLAARKRKPRSDVPADTPDPLPTSHQRKSTSPPSKVDSYHSSMSMPSSDSQASLDLETNTGYDFLACLYLNDFCVSFFMNFLLTSDFVYFRARPYQKVAKLDNMADVTLARGSVPPSAS